MTQINIYLLINISPEPAFNFSRCSHLIRMLRRPHL